MKMNTEEASEKALFVKEELQKAFGHDKFISYWNVDGVHFVIATNDKGLYFSEKYQRLAFELEKSELYSNSIYNVLFVYEEFEDQAYIDVPLIAAIAVAFFISTILLKIKNDNIVREHSKTNKVPACIFEFSPSRYEENVSKAGNTILIGNKEVA